MARKSRDFKDLMRENTSSQNSQKHIEALRDKMLEEGTLAEYASNMVIQPKGTEKMSDIMKRFVEPYEDTVDNLRDFRSLFSLAAIAWNAALMADSEQKEEIDILLEESLQGKDAEVQQFTRQIIAELIARKKKHFSHIKRFIVDFDITETREQYHIAVVSTLLKELEEQQ
ncbi:MAG TPA: hypothetical protein VK203_27145 [Nostocaceae cyanobacterium]|nr:hypothetical protein [Nostocaceae cyanobacterium]